MTLITGSEIYWITRLDEVRDCFGPLGLLLATFGIIGSVILIGMYIASYDKTSPEVIKKHRYVELILGIFFIFMVIFAIALKPIKAFIPTTKQMAMIKIIPAIANNEDVQEECKELYQLAKEGLKELVKEEGEK